MKRKAISFYSKFHCIGSKCPSNCCQNWVIRIDDETHKHMMREAFPKNLKYRIFTVNEAGGFHHIRTIAGKCPYLRAGLCSFQWNHRMDLMPQICQVYPRRVVSYGSEAEISLELSCIHAAELFLETEGRLTYEEVEDDTIIMWEQGNQDPGFLTFLQESRERMLDYLWEDSHGSLVERQEALYDYVLSIHRFIVRDQIENAAQVKCKPRDKGAGETFFYPISFLNQILLQDVSFAESSKKNPTLHHLIDLYIKHAGKLYEDEAEEVFKIWYQEMITAYPKLEDTYLKYFSYVLQQIYTESYEDYHVLRKMLEALWFVDVWKLLDTVSYQVEGKAQNKTKELDPGNQSDSLVDEELSDSYSTNWADTSEEAKRLAAVERGFRHRLRLHDIFLERARQEILS
ncbi:MAG: flagellin lysine-N-methylase [Lachnospiraceae bacterium]|nr:flagellin lysine-N-methylase [Lachnospiraceae bacterium]